MYKFKYHTRVDLATLEEMTKNGHSKQFAFYILIKSKYKHSISYNYTYNKLAKLTKLNPKTVYGLSQKYTGIKKWEIKAQVTD